MSPHTELEKIGADWWESSLRSNPTRATYLGDHRYDDRLPEIDAAAREHDRRHAETILRRLKAIDPASLSEGERVRWDMLRLQNEWFLEHLSHKFYQWEVDQMMGPQVWFLELFNYHPLDDEKGQRDLLARWHALPRHIDQYLANLREGIAEGRVAPRIAQERVATQIDGILAQPPFQTLFTKVQNAALKGDFERALANAVLPSYAKLRDFLRRDYPGREEVGLSALPNGRTAYEYCVRLHTTTNLTASDLHQIGLEELAGIQKEMRAIAKGDEKEFLARLMKDARNFHSRKEDLVKSFETILADVEKCLARYFGRLPKTKCIVKPIEEYREKDAPAAYYYQPDDKCTRPGIFYANTYSPETRPIFNEKALTVHEAVPGHHLQIALAIETNLPMWQRHTHFTAFVEGWALYAERLADEMGVYTTELERFGMLTYQAWRACRLAVDTGLHALGWSRDQAIQFFRDNVAIGGPETANEVDRYIIWPGQALAYKVGQREIESLRREAEQKLGVRFRLSDFHDIVLRHGALPLSTLRYVVRNWLVSA